MTRTLMGASALFLGLLGALATFAPEHLLGVLGAPQDAATLLLAQVTGALYVGFAGLNWMARHNLIGGIYSRPVAIGNLMHFLVAAMAMLKAIPGSPPLSQLWPVALLYSAFAAAFGLVLVRSPVGPAPGGSRP